MKLTQIYAIGLFVIGAFAAQAQDHRFASDNPKIRKLQSIGIPKFV